MGLNAPTGFSYDLLGNLLSKSDFGSYSYGQNGAGLHAVTEVNTGSGTLSYTYDANGNMTGGNGRTLTWTSSNLLAQVAKGGVGYAFAYGTDRLRYKKVRTEGTSQTTHYVGDVFEKITQSGLITYRHYVKVGGKAVAIVVDPSVGNDVTKYLHRDHLGSITTITDSTGAVLERLSYDSHGKRRSATTWQAASITAAEIRGYTGHEHLDDVGLIHMNGRVYDPELGRMLSPDPVTQAPDNAQAYNRYAYVLNNPLRYSDPSGYVGVDCGVTLQGGVGCGVGPISIGFGNEGIGIGIDLGWVGDKIGDFVGGLFGRRGPNPGLQRAIEMNRKCWEDPICGEVKSRISPASRFGGWLLSRQLTHDSDSTGDKPGQGEVVGATIAFIYESDGLERFKEAVEKYDLAGMFSNILPAGNYQITVRIAELKADEWMNTPDAITILVNSKLLGQPLNVIASSIGHELIHVDDYLRGGLDRSIPDLVNASERRAYFWQIKTASKFHYDEIAVGKLFQKIEEYR